MRVAAQHQESAKLEDGSTVRGSVKTINAAVLHSTQVLASLILAFNPGCSRTAGLARWQCLCHRIPVMSTNVRQKMYGDDIFFEQRAQKGSWATHMNLTYAGLRAIHKDPDIFEVNNFITDEEVEELIQLGRPRLQPSLVGKKDSEDGEKVQQRTSSTAFLQYDEAMWLMNKVSALTKKPISHMEPPQVGHYKADQIFAGHYDAADMTTPSGKLLFETGGNRLITVLIYLNSLQEGGGTLFDELGLEIRPEKGKALIFFPATMDAKRDLRLYHQAVKPGGDSEKWVTQIWIREGELPKDDPVVAFAIYAAVAVLTFAGGWVIPPLLHPG